MCENRLNIYDLERFTFLAFWLFGRMIENTWISQRTYCTIIIKMLQCLICELQVQNANAIYSNVEYFVGPNRTGTREYVLYINKFPWSTGRQQLLNMATLEKN